MLNGNDDKEYGGLREKSKVKLELEGLIKEEEPFEITKEY